MATYGITPELHEPKHETAQIRNRAEALSPGASCSKVKWSISMMCDLIQNIERDRTCSNDWVFVQFSVFRILREGAPIGMFVLYAAHGASIYRKADRVAIDLR